MSTTQPTSLAISWPSLPVKVPSKDDILADEFLASVLTINVERGSGEKANQLTAILRFEAAVVLPLEIVLEAKDPSILSDLLMSGILHDLQQEVHPSMKVVFNDLKDLGYWPPMEFRLGKAAALKVQARAFLGKVVVHTKTGNKYVVTDLYNAHTKDLGKFPPTLAYYSCTDPTSKWTRTVESFMRSFKLYEPNAASTE